MKKIFRSADILLPKTDALEDWAVIACDQFTSQPDYWERVEEHIKGKPSAGHLILSEFDLEHRLDERIAHIHRSMDAYLQQNLFTEYPDSYVYVERTLLNGTIRRGLVGAIDLEAYDFHAESTSPIRASEQTVLGRIPVRLRIREKASLELSHVLMLADDDRMSLIAPITARKEELPILYDFDLMEGGGHITGWLVQGDEASAFDKRLSDYMEREWHRYEDLDGKPLLFAVGDGNHSIVTAKEIYEAEKAAHPGEDLSRSPLRYTMVELENLYDEVQQIESIYRIVKHTDPEKLLAHLKDYCVKETGMTPAPAQPLPEGKKAENGQAEGTHSGYPVVCCIGNTETTIYLDPSRGQLAVSILQDFLDYYLSHEEGEIDYIHGEDVVRELSKQPGCIGFLMQPIRKEQLFPSLKTDGPLTRKTFSMGHAKEKRYYLEARRIR